MFSIAEKLRIILLGSYVMAFTLSPLILICLLKIRCSLDVVQKVSLAIVIGTIAQASYRAAILEPAQADIIRGNSQDSFIDDSKTPSLPKGVTLDSLALLMAESEIAAKKEPFYLLLFAECPFPFLSCLITLVGYNFRNNLRNYFKYCVGFVIILAAIGLSYYGFQSLQFNLLKYGIAKLRTFPAMTVDQYKDPTGKHPTIGDNYIVIHTATQYTATSNYKTINRLIDLGDTTQLTLPSRLDTIIYVFAIPHQSKQYRDVYQNKTTGMSTSSFIVTVLDLRSNQLSAGWHVYPQPLLREYKGELPNGYPWGELNDWITSRRGRGRDR